MSVECQQSASESANAKVRPYCFLENSKMALRRDSAGAWESAGDELAARGVALRLVEVGKVGEVGVAFAQIDESTIEECSLGCRVFALKEIYELLDSPGALSDSLKGDLPLIRANAIRIPYLYFKDTDYIYRFRADKQRNREVYRVDESSIALYHSALCDAIKAVKRAKERSASTPAALDFGAVEYVLPSHFGFCLGVQNAIERAYETIAAHPNQRVFMLSELIHNPFVNEDLKSRGLLYLQSDKGVPVCDPETNEPYWDSLTDSDIVIIPAFGARDEDKVRLIERGLPLNAYDATCMLVEKVWKAAKRYGQRGFTVVIHGKAEHEETKATFSNSAKYAPSMVVRDMKEAEALAAVIEASDEGERLERFEAFRDRCSPGFDPERNLRQLAVVNQTTLLRNETLKIIACLEASLERRFGKAHIEEHMAMSSKGDTLCYATQVNQDALAQAIGHGADAAIVVGGKNSSNTFQLFRICQEEFGENAFYIQSERNIVSDAQIEHFVFPYDRRDPKQGRLELRAFLPEKRDGLRILITGGASCPDGLLQQVIARINGFFPSDAIRSIDEVIAEIGD